MRKSNTEKSFVIKCICLGCKAKTSISLSENWLSDNRGQDAFPDSFEKSYGICPSCRDKIFKMFGGNDDE